MSITVVGLGPGHFGLLTIETWDLLRTGRPLYVQTENHPVVSELVKQGIAITQFDKMADSALNLETMYEAMAAQIVAKAAEGENLIFAVPGNPAVDQQITKIIMQMAADRRIDVTILAAMGFQERKPVSLDPLTDVMARLRSPGGCMWDLEQTHSTLRRYMVEEVYEVLEAIDNRDSAALCEELGDLLLQIVFHARIAEEGGQFSIQDVIDEVTAKMVRRHPHVFGEVLVRNADEVLTNWDEIKKREKSHTRRTVLDGVPQGLPSLMRAYKLQMKAAKVGFDWDNINDVWGKLQEEWDELKQAVASGDDKAVAEEMGDLLFAAVNLARFLKVEPETVLNLTNNKFINRFRYVEARVVESGQGWETFTLKDLDKFWQDVKIFERKQ